MATREQLLDDYNHFTNQAFRHLEQLPTRGMTPEQELQAAQIKATLALAAATAATVATDTEQ